MSRSRKKHPIHSVTTTGARAGVQKSWKKECNKTLRIKSHDLDLPNNGKYKRISGDIWSSPSDGKTFSRDPKAFRK